MMKKHLSIWLPALLLLVAVAACSKDKRDYDWEKTINQDSPEAYRAYIAKHPDSQYLEMAKYHLERMVYRKAMNENTVAAYTRYLAEFPKGHWADNARNARATLISSQLRQMPDDKLAAVRVRFETDRGAFTVRVFPDKAPLTSRNFVSLAAGGFYDGLTIHRVEPKLLVQSGDPRGDSLGGPGYFIPFENTGIKHVRGALVMWHLPVDPNTAGSQFYICLADLPDRDGKFAVFGEVVDGLPKLDEISQAESTGPKGSPPFQPKTPIKIVRTVTEGMEVK